VNDEAIKNKLQETKKEKKEDLWNEYKLLISMLISNKNIEYRIRGWCLTIWALFIGASMKLNISMQFGGVICILIIFAFWILSISHSYFLEKDSIRIIQIQNYFSEIDANNFVNIEQIVSPKILYKLKSGTKLAITKKAIKQKNMIAFYIVIILITFIVYWVLIPYYDPITKSLVSFKHIR